MYALLLYMSRLDLDPKLLMYCRQGIISLLDYHHQLSALTVGLDANVRYQALKIPRLNLNGWNGFFLFFSFAYQELECWVIGQACQ